MRRIVVFGESATFTLGLAATRKVLSKPRFESDAIGSASLPASGRAPQPVRYAAGDDGLDMSYMV